MASPFAVFRKNQKVLTVVLTGLAMFAFIILDSARGMSGGMSTGLMVFVAACVGAGILWVFGSQGGKGKGKEFAIYGAIIGGAAGFLAMRVSGPQPVVQTSIGNYFSGDLQTLVDRRRAANQFVAEAFITVGAGNAPSNHFGGSERESVLLGELFRYEADELGIVVSDETVTDYIKRLTGGRLTGKQLRQIRSEMSLSEKDLYGILRDELKAQIGFRMSVPRNSPTPVRYWQLYRRMNVEQELAAAEISVDAFLKDVPDPSSTELAAMFEQYGKSFPLVDGTPGFRQPRKIAIAYLTIDAESVKADVAAVTDEDVAAYYEENKDIYRNLDFSLFNTDDNEDKPIDPLLTPEDEKPAVAPQPTDSKPKGDDEKGELPKEGEQGSQNDDCFQPESKSATEPETSVGDQPAIAQKPSTNPLDDKEPEPEYRPLEEVRDEIREEIERERTNQAITAKARSALSFMQNLTEGLEASVDETSADQTPEQIEKKTQKAVGDMRADAEKYAKKNGLTPPETTKPLSDFDFRDLEDPPIGSAVEPRDDVDELDLATQAQQPPQTTVLQNLFGDSSKNLGFSDWAENQLDGTRYVYWKIADQDPYVPENIGEVKEQVLTAWKQSKAREKAEQRAKKLAEMVQKGELESEVLENKTVTGKAGSDLLSVIRTGSFSWMRQSSVPPLERFLARSRGESSPGLELSTIPGISDSDSFVGMDFMRIVFEELNEGETGVAANLDKSAYYVVQVHSRFPATDQAKDDLRKEFLSNAGEMFTNNMFGMPSPYSTLIQSEQQQTTFKWRQQLVEKKYAVQWADRAEQR